MNDALVNLNLDPTGIRHIEQYFGPWAMVEDKFNSVLQQVRTADWHAHVAAMAATPVPAIGSYRVSENGVAIIDVIGTMTKYGSSFSAMRHGTVGVQAAVRSAARDSDVRGIVIRIDSPGGSVAGTSDLGEEIAKAAQKKPVIAFIEDLGASGAYWIASQATRIVANSTAFIGSIGVYTVLYDWSAAAAQEGVKVIVVRSAEMKGMGTPGTEITPSQLADAQRVINSIHEQFVGVVMKGRKKEREHVEQLADGRVHIASAALKLGLIDEIGDMESAIGMAISKKPSRAPGAANMEAIAMANEDAPVIKPATLDEMRAACPGADNDFLIKQLDRKATATECAQAWMQELNGRVSAEKKRADDAEKAAKESPKSQGVDPIVPDKPGSAPKAEESGDVIAQFNAAVTEKTAKGMDRMDAVMSVAKDKPELHRAYLMATNGNPKAQRLIQEKYVA